MSAFSDLDIAAIYRQLVDATTAKVAAATLSRGRHQTHAATLTLPAITPTALDLRALAQQLRPGVVLISQYQTLPECRLQLAQLLQTMLNLDSESANTSPQPLAVQPLAVRPLAVQPLAVALDNFSPQHQAMLDAVTSGKINLLQFEIGIKDLRQQGVRALQSLVPLLQLGRQKKIKLLAADAPLNVDSLTERNATCRQVVAAWQEQNPQGLCFVLAGEARLQQPDFYQSWSEPTILLQAWDEVFWRMQGELPTASDAVLQWGPKLFSLTHIPPLVKLDSFLTWSRGLEGWPGWPATTTAEQVRQLILKSFRLSTTPPPQIYACGDWQLLKRIKASDDLLEDEARALLSQIQAGESYYLPRPNLIYLATLDGYHLGEEIGHSVRLQSIPNSSLEHQPEKSLTAAERFYLIAVNEAAGYLASKVVAPGRSIDKGSLRLSRAAASSDFKLAWDKLDPETLLAKAHSAGYGLGERLFRAMQGYSMRRRSRWAQFGFAITPKIAAPALHPLFSQPLLKSTDAQKLYLRLSAQLEKASWFKPRSLHGRVHWLALFYFFCMFLPALLWIDQRQLLHLPKPLWKNWQTDLTLVLFASGGLLLLLWLAQRFSKSYRQLRQQLQGFFAKLTFEERFFLAIFSAVAEEFLFRGAIQGELGWIAGAVAFSLVYLIPDRRYWLWPVLALLLGAVLGLSYVNTGNLLVPVLIHFIVTLFQLRK